MGFIPAGFWAPLNYALAEIVSSTWPESTSNLFLQEEVGKAITNLESDLNSQLEGHGYHCTLPEEGWLKEKVLDEIDTYMALGIYYTLANVIENM